MRIRPNFTPATSSTLMIFALTGAWTTVIARGVGPWSRSVPVPAPLNSFPALVIALVAAVLVIYLMRRYSSRIVWEVLFFCALFFGVWYMGLLIFSFWLATLVAALTVALPFVFPRVLFHNLFVVAGSVGVALNLALRLSPEGIVLFLVGFSLYDMLVAGYGGPLVTVVKELIRGKSIPGLIVPGTWGGWLRRLDGVCETDAVFLGTGDLILPMTMVARASFSGWGQSSAVLIGILVGWLVLVARSDMHPRAALPWIAAGGSIPFLVMRAAGLFV